MFSHSKPESTYFTNKTLLFFSLLLSCPVLINSKNSFLWSSIVYEHHYGNKAAENSVILICFHAIGTYFLVSLYQPLFEKENKNIIFQELLPWHSERVDTSLKFYSVFIMKTVLCWKFGILIRSFEISEKVNLFKYLWNIFIDEYDNDVEIEWWVRASKNSSPKKWNLRHCFPK